MRNRVLIRLGSEININQDFIDEAILTVSDRLNIRLGTVEIPFQFESIVVDAVVKMYRRQYYEGIESEQIDTISTRFVDNILEEYELEIQSFINEEGRNVVRFI